MRLAGFVSALILTCVAFAAQALEPGPLKGPVFGSGSDALVVVLHGDLSRGGAATYHYAFAKRVADQNSNAVAAALLRPGYYDDEGRTSPGSNNNRKDHYTEANNALVAETIANLKVATGAARTIVVGHSGGAAQTGVLMGKEPGLIDVAVLVSCPCDVPAWRQARGRSAWPRSESPQDHVAAVSPASRIIAATGSNDKNTAAAWAIKYVNAAKTTGAYAEFIKIEGAKHGFNRMADKIAAIVAAEIAR